MGSQPELSIIIVNYNTRNDLINCLKSIYSSTQDVSYEVWVVDNDSIDGSVHAVEIEFPQVKLIRSSNNLGFSKANNLALRNINTNFVLLLNPDTLLTDHVFDTSIDFLIRTPDAGMMSCKLVKGDGKLDLACRRSFPTPLDGFCRAIGLSRMFPNSRLFARYNLTYLNEDETTEVEAINGAFMMVKHSAIQNVGLLDEDYFMYMEDLDWCYRFKNNKWKIYYVPDSKVIHLKGQSGKKNSAIMIREFFKSMELFCRKNYKYRQTKIKYAILICGIRIWKTMVLTLDSMRSDKRVTP